MYLEQQLHLNLECEDEAETRLSVPIVVDITRGDVTISVKGYETDLCVSLEYYNGVLQVLVWNEDTLDYNDGDCKKIILSTDVPATMKKIDEYYNNIS